MISQDILDRFWSKVDKKGENECWLWTAGCFNTGYGSFYVHGKSERAHRFAYGISVGPIGDKLVCHSCDIPLCMNPAHLFLGTSTENIQDAVGKGRMHIRGEHSPRAILSEEDIHDIRRRLDLGQTHKMIGNLYMVHSSTIGRISSGDNWSHLR